MRRETSLFARLALRISLVLGIGAGLLVTAAWYYARAAADDAYDRLLLGAALQMADGLTVEGGQLIVNLPTSAFELLGLAGRDRVFYRITDPSGRTLTGYGDLEANIDPTTVRREPVLESGRYKGEAVRIAVVSRALADSSAPGWAHVVVAQTTEARRTLAGELTLRASVLVAVMSLLALAGAMLAIRYALKPIERLGAALRRRDPQDQQPVTVEVPRELGPFIASINHFMGRFNERAVLLRHFVSDAAHQIRTPLTALSAQLDLLDGDRLDETARQHLYRVQVRAKELARLTNQLLSHAMVIHRTETAQLQPVDLVDVARRAFRAAIPITVDPDIVISFEAPDEHPIVSADAISLREAIVNVIDNALRHGTTSRLDVRVCIDDGSARVEVEDDGPGIPPQEWGRITRRFETSKSSGGSTGLGFAIASEVVAAFGGGLSFREKQPGAGFTVVLTLQRTIEKNV
ncbi:sensor histidine kinase [Pseudaminobacter soli (ex Li et al. 2025)]|uniref:histidine kinase n=1 Tax=Pseudaminobacter soli (ex Li et al. 2025) TaxID=1295366 RepID=A0A2P7S0T0_9HYPH|nr:sensor histidine kinase [Mesorhizobium soli]PSJ56069.1 sensor histidine kinase [Mesorhizobium soli]